MNIYVNLFSICNYKEKRYCKNQSNTLNTYIFKKLLIILPIILLYNCNTVEIQEAVTKETVTTTTEEIIIIEPEDKNKLRQALSDNILANTDEYHADFAALILDLIRNKKWESLSEMTDQSLYSSYVVESDGSLIDFSMFMLHTGDKGISTNYSLNEIESAFYTDNYIIDDNIYFEGLYLYSTGETEFFKILIQESEIGLIITRE